jgi:hypothetical protein
MILNLTERVKHEKMVDSTLDMFGSNNLYGGGSFDPAKTSCYQKLYRDSVLPGPAHPFEDHHNL